MALRKFGKKKDAESIIIKKIEGGSAAAEEGEGNWLISYADMMTLLCGFFIMLFSMAKLDDPKYDSFKEAVTKQFGGEYTSPTKELAKFATEIIQEAGLTQEAMIKSDPGSVSIVFESTLFFDTLSAEVRTEGRPLLTKIVEKLVSKEKETGKPYKIVVEGHTDNRPIVSGVFPSNWELSGARASRIVRMFLEKGYDPKRLIAIGYADTQPAITQTRTPAGTYIDEALSKNRRVVIRILEPRMDAIPFPEKTEAETPPTAAAAPAAAVVQPATPDHH